MNLDGYTPGDKVPDAEADYNVFDAWILSRLAAVAGDVDRNIREYHFDRAAGDLYQFVWHEFCDWYLELVKPVLSGDDPRARQRTQTVLAHAMSVILRLLHPVIPFVTEEIWDKLPGAEGLIITAPWPTPDDGLPAPRAEHCMDVVRAVTTAVRNIRGEMNVPPSQKVRVVMMAEDENTRMIILKQSSDIMKLVRAESLDVVPPGEKPKGAAAQVAGGVEVFVVLAGLIDLEAEARRLHKEIAKVDKEIVGTEKKLSNEDFLAKAPPEVVDKARNKLAELSQRREKLDLNLARVREIEE
jgi:valyl-tRNA synthetase